MIHLHSTLLLEWQTLSSACGRGEPNCFKFFVRSCIGVVFMDQFLTATFWQMCVVCMDQFLTATFRQMCVAMRKQIDDPADRVNLHHDDPHHCRTRLFPKSLATVVRANVENFERQETFKSLVSRDLLADSTSDHCLLAIQSTTTRNLLKLLSLWCCFKRTYFLYSFYSTYQIRSLPLPFVLSSSFIC